MHKLCLVTISRVKAKTFIFFTLLRALIVGFVYLETSRLVTGSHSTQSPVPRVSTNRPIYHQNKLTVHKQHNHNATYNNGL